MAQIGKNQCKGLGGKSFLGKCFVPISRPKKMAKPVRRTTPFYKKESFKVKVKKATKTISKFPITYLGGFLVSFLLFWAIIFKIGISLSALWGLIVGGGLWTLIYFLAWKDDK